VSEPVHHRSEDRPVVPAYAAPRRGLRELVLPAGVLAAAVGVLLVLYAINTRDRSAPAAAPGATGSAPLTVTLTPSPGSSSPDVAAQRRQELLDVYFRQVIPQLDKSLLRKRAASERAIAGLRERLDGHRHGIPRFADDVTRWGTRFGVMGRMSKDAWNRWWNDDPNAAATRRYIEAKFRAHVLAERDLQEELEAAVQQFVADLEADRNELFADIRLPLRASKVNIAVADAEWARVRRQIMSRAGTIAEAGAKDTLVSGLTAVTVSGVAGWAAERIVIQVLARVAPMVAAQLGASAAVAGGGAMAGGAGGGGAVGSVAGPAGTVIGIGAGIVVGAAIDWWMTEKFKEKLAEQCNRFLNTVRDQLIDGSGNQPGLRAVFDEAVRLSDEAQRKAILDVLLEENGSPPTTAPVR
jgi:hypothetical protein